MAKHLTIADLKKELNMLEHKQLLEIITSLYKNDEKVKDMLCIRFMREEYQREVLEKYKNKMHEIFFIL